MSADGVARPAPSRRRAWRSALAVVAAAAVAIGTLVKGEVWRFFAQF